MPLEKRGQRQTTARRLFRIVEPIHGVTNNAAEPTGALMALGHRNVWDACDAGREIKERIESLTDELAAPPYDSLEPSELDQLIAESSPSPQRSTLPAPGRSASAPAASS